MEEIQPTYDGFLKLRDLISHNRQDEDDPLQFYPLKQVDVVVEYEDRTGSGTAEGTLLMAKKSLEQDEDSREENRYNGWFGKARLAKGLLNIYADPGSSGPRIIFVREWDGTGGRRYKYPITKILVEEKIGTAPQCYRCGNSLSFGMYHDVDEGNHYGATMGWVCRSCSTGRDVRGLHEWREEDPVGGLP